MRRRSSYPFFAVCFLAAGLSPMIVLPAAAQRILKVRDADGDVVRKPKPGNADAVKPAPGATATVPLPSAVNETPSPSAGSAICIAGCVAKR